ncbi:hypothetical protein ACIRPT_21075 [Streptomyces sp. NPDC101227]|uniref:hypothetical protein n=1 Tax=Streptomyces sp. NPDC101227 TaxID=3366136 RepID=UPI0037F13904
MPDRKSPHSERELAWHAHLDVATRAPFGGGTPGGDPDCLVGEAVYDSLAVHSALHRLAAGITPDSPLVPLLLPALVAAQRLLTLRSAWIDYCNERFRLDPAADDVTSEMSRQYVTGDDVRAWARYAEARTAYAEATGAVRELNPVLARSCGRAGSANALTPDGLERSGLCLVPGMRTTR